MIREMHITSRGERIPSTWIDIGDRYLCRGTWFYVVPIDRTHGYFYETIEEWRSDFCRRLAEAKARNWHVNDADVAAGMRAAIAYAKLGAEQLARKA